MEHHGMHYTGEVLTRLVRRRWRHPLEIAGAVGLALTVFGLTAFHPSATIHADDTPPGPVQAQGVVRSGVTKGIGAAFPGALLELSVQPGQQVRKGELLFSMDTSVLEAQLAAAAELQKVAWMNLQQARANRSADLSGWVQQEQALVSELGRARREAHSWSQEPRGLTYGPDGAVYMEVAPFDDARLAELEAQLHAVRQQLAAVKQSWAPTMQQAEAEHHRAALELKQTRSLLAAAIRRSPIDGVVTGVYAHQGAYLQPGQTIVRVDDPSSYRVVALVNRKVREQLRQGSPVPLEAPSGKLAGTLERIESGWDEHLFEYFVWVKPADPTVLKPDDAVRVTLPAVPLTASASL